MIRKMHDVLRKKFYVKRSVKLERAQKFDIEFLKTSWQVICRV